MADRKQIKFAYTPECECYGCEKRAVNCHTNCEKFAEYRKEIEEKAIETRRQIDSVAFRYAVKDRIARKHIKKINECAKTKRFPKK